jgi:hypothetical protein
LPSSFEEASAIPLFPLLEIFLGFFKFQEKCQPVGKRRLKNQKRILHTLPDLIRVFLLANAKALV